MTRSVFWDITSWNHVEGNKGYRTICRLHIHADFLINLCFEPDHRGDIFLRNVGWLSSDYMALYPRRWTVQKSYKIMRMEKLSLRSASHDFLLSYFSTAKMEAIRIFLRQVGPFRNYTALQTTKQIFIATVVRTEIPYDFVLSVSHFLLPEVPPLFFKILVVFMHFLLIL
jgi:hypothetical protein